MKKYLLLFLSLLLFTASYSQVKKKRYNRAFIGINMGGTWEQSDVRDFAHLGLGFTFGKYYFQNETNMFDFGWRFRYLHGMTSGLDTKRNTDIKNNPALMQLNYDSLGYVYNNYRMTFDEGAFEIMIGLNRLREKTRIVLYAFGGIGISGYQTQMNQLNGSKIYNYDSLGASPSLADIDAFLDNTDESNAYGNSDYKIRFVPSLGLGIGWQTRRGHYIGLEHRMTFTLNDYADGVVQSGGGFFGGSNDLYHYGGVFVRWMLGGGGSSSTYHTTDPNVYTHNPPPPPTNTTTPTYTTTVVNPPPPPPPPPPPANQKPQIVINYPQTSPYTTNSTPITVTASVLNVGNRNDITVKVNGFPTPNFAYDMVTKALTVTAALNPGNNSFYISAVNPYGNDWKNVNVIYQPGGGNPPGREKPLITLTYPGQNPFTTNQNTITVTGTVINVNSRNEITAYVNNVPNGTFKYDAITKVLSVTTTLVLGTNTVKFNATNADGSDSKTQTIIYQTATPPPPPPSPKPVVTITSPGPSPYHTDQPVQTVYATVLNVASQNDINLIVNGSKTVNFSYDPATKNLMVTSNLNTGNNIFSITATNPQGSDSKSITVVYANKQAGAKPIVTFTNPATSPQNVTTPFQTIQASVVNVNSKNEITVLANGNPVSNFNYDINSKNLDFSTNLNQGNNVFTVTAANAAGSDSKTATLVYQMKKAGERPIVTITNPSTNPYNTAVSSVTVNASILNITSQSDISVLVNSKPTSNFSFNASVKTLTITSNLNEGNNTFVISASNPFGSDSKTQTVVYTKKAVMPPPSVTITSPGNNHSTTQNNVSVTATVLNVSSKNDITVKVNNSVFGNFNYANSTVTFTAPIHLGSNNISVTGTNGSGSDSKSITVTQTKPVELPKPIVNITSPNTNPHTTAVQAITITATVMNVGGKNDIMIAGPNKTNITGFTYNSGNHTVSFPYTLASGDNYFSITATNPQGSDSKSVVVKYTSKTGTGGEIEPPTKGGGGTGTNIGQKPIVTITSPAANPAIVTNPTVNFTATVLHVNSQNDIKITLNGNPVDAFTYNAATKVLTFTATMPWGANNVVTIKGTNAYGSDTKSVTISAN